MQPRRLSAFAVLEVAGDVTRICYAIAASVGSDVPYFPVGGTALGLRRGDEVYPLVDLPQMWVVLVIAAIRGGHKGRLCVAGMQKKGSGTPFLSG